MSGHNPQYSSLQLANPAIILTATLAEASALLNLSPTPANTAAQNNRVDTCLKTWLQKRVHFLWN